MKIIRRRKFSISVGVSDSLPETFADHFATPERRRFLEVFRPRVQRYRRRRRLVVYMLLGFMLGIFVFAKVDMPESLRITGGLILLISFFVCFIFALGPRLRCPACRKRIEPAKGLYCPVCGSDAYGFGRHKRGSSWFSPPYCPSCGCTMDEGSGDDPRSYRIRGCTHCGVMLDEKGL